MKARGIFIAILISLSLYSCDLFMSSYSDKKTYDGNLHISLTDSSGAERSVITAAPSLPSFSAVTIRVSDRGTTIASDTFSGNGPYTLSVPEGSGYRVEADAKISGSPSFGVRLSGVTDNVSTGDGTVQIHLSVSETMIVRRASDSVLYVYPNPAAISDPSAIDSTTINGNEMTSFFFDRYGRLYYIEENDIWQYAAPAANPDSNLEHGTPSDFGGGNINNIAHPIGSDIVYMSGEVGGIQWPLYVSSLSNIDGPATQVFNVDGTDDYAGVDFSVGGYRLAADTDGSVFLLGRTTTLYPCIIKGTVSGSSFTFTGGVSLPDLAGSASIVDMSVIDGTLYVLAKTSNTLTLYAFDTGALTEKWREFFTYHISVLNSANIAGWGKNKVYLSWGEPNDSDIITVDTINHTLDSVLLFNNWNTGSVNSNPTVDTTFTLTQSRTIKYINTYHYSGSSGATPDTISLENTSTLVIYGPWSTTGTTTWECYPNVRIPAGTYKIVDSAPTTWSHNTASDNKGFAKVRGIP